ncbi:WD40-repeat-containing domain protein [Haematococcus lacustris]
MDPALDPTLSPSELARAIREKKAREQQQRIDEARAAEEAERMAMKMKMLEIQKKYGAGSSHVLNDQYMDEFEKGWNALNGTSATSNAGGGKSSNVFTIQAAPKAGVDSIRPGSSNTAARTAIMQARTRNIVNTGKAVGLAGFTRFPPQVLDTWRQGPTDPAGTLADISDRPSLCSAANWGKNEVVVGSSDHALYVIDAEKGTKKRQLYNKSSGHSEWVTAVACTPDGKVVSGGMDSRMWLWPLGTTRGIMMEGHGGPISQLCYDSHTGMVVSASYDKTVRMWQCGSRGEQRVVLTGHEAPVMELGISTIDGKMITGDRSGHVILWDTTASDVSWRLRGVHTGQVSALAWCDAEDPDLSGFFISGGQDGHVRVWDPREKKNPKRIMLHVTKEGKGAVTSICGGGVAAANKVVTCGADMTLRVLEPRKGFALMSTLRLTDYPYSMAVAGGLALVGCGDGSLSVVDIRDCKRLYALGAHNGAVRCIEACADRLFTSGDDGKTMLWSFPGIEMEDAGSGALPPIRPGAGPARP